MTLSRSLLISLPLAIVCLTTQRAFGYFTVNAFSVTAASSYSSGVYYEDGSYFLDSQLPRFTTVTKPTVAIISQSADRTSDDPSFGGTFFGTEHNAATVKVDAEDGVLRVKTTAESGRSLDGTYGGLAGPEVGVTGTASSLDSVTFFSGKGMTTALFTISLYVNIDQEVGSWGVSSSVSATDENGVAIASASYSSGSSFPQNFPGYSDTMNIADDTTLLLQHSISAYANAGTDGYSADGNLQGTPDDMEYNSVLDAQDTSYFTITPETPGAYYIAASGTVYDGSAVPEPALFCLVGLAAFAIRRRP